MRVWGLITGQYERNFERNLQDNYLAFKEGLICDFIISSCLTVIENILEIPIISLKYLFLGKLILQQF